MNKLKLFLFTFITFSIVFFTGCTQQQSPPPKTTTEITIQNFAFHPDNITITIGGNVTWINEDSVVHQIKEDSGLFLSDRLGNGQSFTYTFTTPGIFTYTCTIHSSMKGKVIVK